MLCVWAERGEKRTGFATGSARACGRRWHPHHSRINAVVSLALARCLHTTPPVCAGAMRKFDNNSFESAAERARTLSAPKWVLRRKCYSTVDDNAKFDPVSTKHR